MTISQASQTLNSYLWRRHIERTTNPGAQEERESTAEKKLIGFGALAIAVGLTVCALSCGVKPALNPAPVAARWAR